MILVFAHDGDAPARSVVERLRERGARPVVLDAGDVQRRWRAKARFHAAAYAITIEHDGGTFDAGEIGAVLWRRMGQPSPGDDDPRLSAYLAAEARQHLSGLFGLLDAFWLPARPHHLAAMQHKLPQLAIAQRLGFEIPPTLVPTGADDVIAFWEEHDGHVVSKPLGPTAFRESYTGVVARYTEPLTGRQLAHADGVARCPVILQRRLDKRAELRVTVVGERVFAAEIASQDSNHTRTDWRKYDHHATAYRAVTLPPALAARCVALVGELGLAYGAIDLIVTRDGRHVFLEINPSGEYGFVQERAGLPISDAIAELLIARDTAHQERPCAPASATPCSR